MMMERPSARDDEMVGAFLPSVSKEFPIWQKTLRFADVSWNDRGVSQQSKEFPGGQAGGTTV